MKTLVTVLNEEIALKGGEWFVTMTDKFLSGWGLASGLIAKRVIICNTYDDAEKLYCRLQDKKHGMRYVNITRELPRYSGARYVVSYDVFKENLFNF